MSYDEYIEEYLLAQQNPNAPYYMVSFDVVNSQELSPKESYLLYERIMSIIEYVYHKLSEMERILKKQILIKDNRFARPWTNKPSYMFEWYYTDPYFLGDCFQFTVLRDTVSKEQIVTWVNEAKDMLLMKEEFHIADGYYESNDLNDNHKFYRGYCGRILAVLHKPEFQKKIANARIRIRRRNKQNQGQ